MSKRKTTIEINGETSPDPDKAPEENLTAELPFFQSPPVAPAHPEPAESPAAEPIPPVAAIEIAETIAEPTTSRESVAVSANVPTPGVSILQRAQTAFAQMPRLTVRPRHRRYALLAACVTLAAAFGAIAGIAATGGLARHDATVAVQENQAAQQSIARLTKEISGLKANLEAANKSAHVQFAKLSDRLNHEASEITGSVTPPKTVAPPAQSSTPLPAPRPPEAIQPTHPPIVTGWSIREMRDGYVYVQGRGDIYQVVPGAPLPGLGPVEQIKRQDGRWVVVTPRGIIVSMRDRQFFGQF